MADAEQILIQIAVSGQDSVISALGEIGEKGESIFERLASSMGAVGEAFAGLVTAAIGVGVGLEAMASSSAHAGHELENLSRLTGASVENLSGLEGALSQFGVGADQIGLAFRRMAVTVQRAWEEIQQETKKRTDQIVNDQLAVAESGQGIIHAQEGIRNAQLAASGAAIGVAQTKLNLRKDYGEKIDHDEKKNIRIEAGQQAEAYNRVKESRLKLAEAEQKAREAAKKQHEDDLNDINNVADAIDKVAKGTATLGEARQQANLTAENVIKGLAVGATPGAETAISNFKGNIADLAGLSPQVLPFFLKLTDFLHNSGDAALNASVSMHALGRGGAELGAILSHLSSEELLQYIARMQALGFTTDEAAVKISDNFIVSLGKLTSELKVLKDQVGAAFAPTFTEGFDIFRKFIEENREEIVKFAETFAERVKPAILDFFRLISGQEVKTPWIAAIGEGLKAIWDVLKSVGEAIKGFVTGLSGGGMDQLVGGWEKTWFAFGATVRTVLSAINVALHEIATTINDVFGTHLGAADVAVGLLIARWSGLFILLRGAIKLVAGELAAFGTLAKIASGELGAGLTAGVAGATAVAAGSTEVEAAAKLLGATIATEIQLGVFGVLAGAWLADMAIKALKEAYRQIKEQRLPQASMEAMSGGIPGIEGEQPGFKQKPIYTIPLEELEKLPFEKRRPALEEKGASQAQLKELADRELIAGTAQDEAAKKQKEAADKQAENAKKYQDALDKLHQQLRGGAGGGTGAGAGAGGGPGPGPRVPTDRPGDYITGGGQAVANFLPGGQPNFNFPGVQYNYPGPTYRPGTVDRFPPPPPPGGDKPKKEPQPGDPDYVAGPMKEVANPFAEGLKGATTGLKTFTEVIIQAGGEAKKFKVPADLPTHAPPLTGPERPELPGADGGPSLGPLPAPGALTGPPPPGLDELATNITGVNSAFDKLTPSLAQVSDTLAQTSQDSKEFSQGWQQLIAAISKGAADVGSALADAASKISSSVQKTGGGEGGTSSEATHAEGGLLQGPGTGTSDSIKGVVTGPHGAAPARFSAGEFVVKADGSNLDEANEHFRGKGKGHAVGGILGIGVGGVVMPGPHRHYISHGGSISGPGYAEGGAIVSMADMMPMPRYAEGGPTEAITTAPGGGLTTVNPPSFYQGGASSGQVTNAPQFTHAFTLNIGDKSFGGLAATPSAAVAIEQYAVQRRISQGGKKPSWYS
jgi:hypothetical protein